MHAFVVYFDVIFGCLHKPIRFSTGPHAQYTHWKQTVLYIDDVLTVQEGETISGHITCKPNAKNPRDLDIGLTYEFEGKHMASKANFNYHMC